MGETVFPGSKCYGAGRIGSWAGLADGEVIVIGTVTYEFDNDDAVTEGNILVDMGANAVDAVANLVAAIVANPPSPQIDAYVDTIDTAVFRLEGHDHGTPGNLAFTTTMGDGANVIAAGSNLLQGGASAVLKHLESGRYTVTAIDVSAGSIMIPTTLQAPKIVSIQVFSSVGVKKAETTKWTTSNNRIKGDFDGATNPVAGDIVAWSARD